MTRESTGIPGLDDITGGLPEHSLTMVLGPPGTGKTVLALQSATEAARVGRDVVFLSAYAEPHEKLIQHMSSFSFFEPEQVGNNIELLSLKSALNDGIESTLSTIFQIARRKHRPLIILDGYRGMRAAVGPEVAQEMVVGLSVQLPYHQASALITFEAEPDDSDQYAELASADVIISLSNLRRGMRTHRGVEVLKMRGHGYREGAHSLQITDAGVVVFPRLATCLPEGEPATAGERLGTGLVEFDRMLGGGLPQNSATVFHGELGTGKTTFGLHYVLAGAEADENTLILSFYESPAQLMRKSAGLGLDLKSAVDSGRVQILRVPPVEVNPDQLAWRVRSLLEGGKIRRLFIDGVAELERAARLLGDENDYLAALTEYLRGTGVTALMTREEPLVDGSVYGFRGLAADNTVLLRRVEYRGALYRICTVLNMHDSDHDTNIHEFRIGQGGIRILTAVETEPNVLAGIARERPIDGA